jgi:hypothetical protein
VAGFDAEFVVAASQVLDERMAADHDRRGPIGSQTAHRAEPGFESPVVALDAVVRILRGVVERVGEKVVDNAQQRCGQISRHLSRSFAASQHRLEELRRRWDVAPFRHQNVDDLAMLVDGSLHVAPDACHLDVGLIDEPAVADAVSAWPRGVDDERGEALHPPVNGDVIDLHAALGEQFFDIAVRQAVPQVPAHRQQDHVRREPESSE